MDIHALINTTDTHNSPCAERSYQLQTQRIPGPVFQRKRPPNNLTRDEKIQIRTLREYLNWTDSQIAAARGKTVREVQQALTGPLTPPPKRSDRKPRFKCEQRIPPVGGQETRPVSMAGVARNNGLLAAWSMCALLLRLVISMFRYVSGRSVTYAHTYSRLCPTATCL
ncbi:uncharacterized protein C8A04DRAFT_27485 [Dichotomopilus funicola]|uniref:Uncharacterized protein n=1 Tax=Dichotomopilus funicola TaxID=1934379 RepID=A0AAN6V5K3_9PEZI|nr:hypothetical protein C8A04DRAFT_27485 [Dichotomopilus funicola]